jgi:hypothetical protein
LACENVLAYRVSALSEEGEELTRPAYGRNGMSPDAPAHPVPDRWVRLNPRIFLAS